MNNEFDKPESSSAKFLQTVQSLRDLEANWSVDLAKNLEEYLLKICSGEILNNEDSLGSVNFAEAALVLQGSVQVYGRKVKYLYSLVLHALEFISKNRYVGGPVLARKVISTSLSQTELSVEVYPIWLQLHLMPKGVSSVIRISKKEKIGKLHQRACEIFVSYLEASVHLGLLQS
ncbi:uncharacterized protein [Henckelia pumila]|uniref:uncharacterized protein n=1 Tax=Henckelia pumila TaxID=405737 RepID=UPI003C6E155C